MEQASNLNVRSNLMVDDERSKDLRRFLPGDFRAAVYPWDFHGPILDNLSAVGRPTDLQIVEFRQYLKCQRCGLPCAGTCEDAPDEPEEDAIVPEPSKPVETPVMRRERIDPPYRAFALANDGSRTPIDASDLVVELVPGIEIHLDLAPHPNHRGGLPLSTGGSSEADRGAHSTFLIAPGAANVIHVHVRRVESRPLSDNTGPVP